jgi:hypothetical protein
MPPETAIQPTASLALRSGYKRSMGGGIKHSSAFRSLVFGMLISHLYTSSSRIPSPARKLFLADSIRFRNRGSFSNR